MNFTVRSIGVGFATILVNTLKLEKILKLQNLTQNWFVNLKIFDHQIFIPGKSKIFKNQIFIRGQSKTFEDKFSKLLGPFKESPPNPPS